MIRLSLEWLVFNYLFLFLGGIFLIWILYDAVRRRQEGTSNKDRLKCRLCGLDYEDPDAAEISKCPGCGALNEGTR